MSKNKKEENIEEQEEQDTTQLTAEEDAEEIKTEASDEEPEEKFEEEISTDISEEITDDETDDLVDEEKEIPELEAMEMEEPEIEEEKEEEIPEEPIEIIAEEVEEEVDVEEPEIPDVPLEIKAEEIEDEEVEIEDYDFEVEEVKKKKPKKKRTFFGLSVIIGLVVAMAIEVAFSIPLWLYGASRPDLYYIELVLILISLMIPGLITRSVQRGILGAFIIFVISFGLPTILAAAFEIQALSNPLAPLFASTDFALPAFDVFIDLFPTLATLPFEQIQKWIWIVDMIIMFVIVLLVVTFSTWLLKNITKPKKKAGVWIAIPLLSIGLIVFAVFTPIIFSSTYGIIQASTSFLAGSTYMQDAYTLFESEGLEVQSLNPLIEENLYWGNYWLNISQSNYQGLKNIGILNIASLVASQYAPLIEAGDQLALATLALTSVLYPLFNGIFELTQGLKNATDDMANFGGEESLLPSSKNTILFTAKQITDINELKDSLEESIRNMEAARDQLALVQEKISEADISGAFDDVKEILDSLDTEQFIPAVRNIIEEVKDKLGSFDDQLVGFEDFIAFTLDNIDPTIHILWTCYNNIVGNEHMKSFRFAEAKIAFQQAYDNISEITLSSYIPPAGLGGILGVDITEDFSLLLNDLLDLLDPLLQEELAFTSTYIHIFDIVTILDSSDLTQPITYSDIDPIVFEANKTANFTFNNGTIAQDILWDFRNNTAGNVYGTTFSGIGMDFDTILTKNFKPGKFGILTNDMKNVYTALVESLKQYYLFANEDAARFYISVSYDAINITTSTPIEVKHIYNYFNNWSVIIKNINDIMFNVIVGDIDVEINNLFLAIEAK